MKLEFATFGAGCFWGVEETFRTLKGIKETMAGYSGGKTKNPTYDDVCSDETGHAEVVQIKFDPKEISYEKLLDVFWSNHNPTTMNQQGPDFGTQYRSVIFYHSKKQKEVAEKSKDKLNKEKFNGRIVTSIEQAQEFYPAEEYHQKYLMKKGVKVCH
ncbi:peptide-methionine (S)-S-oxide reductase MsrA [Candidatus Micrarchaeota archaeon]|nr:peptide-methionine (S)-S-oxide reductase MsrA [Candidatus Micrarchaeota archaeon]